ncbi:6-phosphogluconolactonase [Rhodococcus sp. (in: high G+C Gram-positive bacteria)]|uniref:6-phosphogluconolactonase n=1 Tax=unclassified Rhodococcus (in: high G+C Gram-positive bacteria) TaxID=192944 RepID=UPI001A097080|nr:6-phosphogluconolactonase [Rhodococcus sp. (in: high G+C Gram-positive bacteria)]MBF0662509.1 6-phosphogluconolactonase [Rhodococcus sp. (in: high G+C Gram-positive bacteria)]
MSDPAKTPTEVLTFADSDAVARAAAKAFVDAVVAAQTERLQAHVVLTGGGTGIAVLEHVGREQGGIDWSAVNVYFGDERFLPPGDPERNEVQARAALLDHVPIDEARIHTMPALGEDGCTTPAESAERYARLLAAQSADGSVPEFDVHLLGMGGEGHINSLFPHTAAVRETERFVVGVDDSPKPPPARVTLTLPAVQRARQVWLLVAGENKADAVAASVGGADPEDIPAAGAHGRERTVWFVDPAAAAKLPTS